MCGIAGIVSPGNGWDLEACMARMLSSITHRGPDGHGVHINEGVALGHRRLAIIDLTKDGAQPMLNANADLVLVFNGEIYNYIELRRDLEARGRRFQSRSDTEVLLQAYGEWGEGCVSRLNGMWSFAILDKRRNLVFCSRQIWRETILLHTSRWRFCFASEIRQLLEILPHRAANRDLLSRFMLASPERESTVHSSLMLQSCRQA